MSESIHETIHECELRKECGLRQELCGGLLGYGMMFNGGTVNFSVLRTSVPLGTPEIPVNRHRWYIGTVSPFLFFLIFDGCLRTVDFIFFRPAGASRPRLRSDVQNSSRDETICIPPPENWLHAHRRNYIPSIGLHHYSTTALYNQQHRGHRMAL